MNKNVKKKPEIKFIEKKYKNSVRYYIEVNDEQMKVSKNQYEREHKKYLRSIKKEKP